MSLRIEKFSSKYGSFEVTANFTVSAGERVALHASSGSGKSTLLRWLAGFSVIASGVQSASSSADEKVSGGLFFDEKPMTALPPEKREFGVVFQDYGLFPHWTAVENVAYGLELRGVSKTEREARAQEWLKKLGVENRATTAAGLLSGGEKQRVALARALIWKPKALLLDEPFAALDLATRVNSRDLVLQILSESPIPTIFVTHDTRDVAKLSTRTVEYVASADGLRHRFGK